MKSDPDPARRGDAPREMREATRLLLITAGTACVVLGVVGMFLPILPTTPFLLLAAVCYARSSRRFYHWLLTNRWFGRYIRNYREGRGIPLREKVAIILLLWLTISYAAWFVARPWWLKAILLGIAVGVTIHLVKTRTLKPEDGEPEPVGEGEAPGEIA